MIVSFRLRVSHAALRGSKYVKYTEAASMALELNHPEPESCCPLGN